MQWASPSKLAGVALLVGGCSLAFPTDELQTGAASSGSSVSASSAGGATSSASTGPGMGGGGSSSTGSEPTYADILLADGPIAYYRLDEAGGAVAANLANAAQPGQFSGSVVFGAAGAITEINAAVTFMQGRLLADPSVKFEGNAAHTIELWFRAKGGTTADGDYPRIFSREQGNAMGRQGLELSINTDAMGITKLFYARWLNGGFDGVVAIVDLDVYTHVACTYDGGNAAVYVNGVLRDSTIGTKSMIPVTVPLTFAAAPGSGSDFIGELDEIVVYDKALAIASIQAHYAAGVANQ